MQSELKKSEGYPSKSKNLDSLWLMKDKNNITAGIEVKLKKLASLYHCIRVFINMRHLKTDPNGTLKLRFDNIYETMELIIRENILRR